MPLEPSQPGRPARKLGREPGLSGLIPLLIGGAAISSLVGLMLFCSAASEMGSTDPVFEDEVQVGLDRQTARMNAGSALKQGREAQERYHSEHDRYTTDFSVITEDGFWEDVTIEVAHADEDTYCMEASYGDVDRYWHLSSESDRLKAGRCP